MLWTDPNAGEVGRRTGKCPQLGRPREEYEVAKSSSSMSVSVVGYGIIAK